MSLKVHPFEKVLPTIQQEVAQNKFDKLEEAMNIFVKFKDYEVLKTAPKQCVALLPLMETAAVANPALLVTIRKVMRIFCSQDFFKTNELPQNVEIPTKEGEFFKTNKSLLGLSNLNADDLKGKSKEALAIVEHWLKTNILKEFNLEVGVEIFPISTKIDSSYLAKELDIWLKSKAATMRSEAQLLNFLSIADDIELISRAVRSYTGLHIDFLTLSSIENPKIRSVIAQHTIISFSTESLALSNWAFIDPSPEMLAITHVRYIMPGLQEVEHFDKCLMHIEMLKSKLTLQCIEMEFPHLKKESQENIATIEGIQKHSGYTPKYDISIGCTVKRDKLCTIEIKAEEKTCQ